MYLYTQDHEKRKKRQKKVPLYKKMEEEYKVKVVSKQEEERRAKLRERRQQMFAPMSDAEELRERERQLAAARAVGDTGRPNSLFSRPSRVCVWKKPSQLKRNEGLGGEGEECDRKRRYPGASVSSAWGTTARTTTGTTPAPGGTGESQARAPARFPRCTR